MSWVTGADGVRLFVRMAGDPANPPILLIHGWSQHSLAWQFQLRDLADRFYLVAPDLRGHGASDKPDPASAYDHSAPWAGDIAAIITELGLTKPLLVGWSMGGWIVGDYLRVHGDGAIAGVTLVGSSMTTGSKAAPGAFEMRSEDVRSLGMLSDDQAANIEATRRFVRVCTHEPLPVDLFADMVGLNMLVPPQIRAASRTRSEDYRDSYRAMTKPLQVLWGLEEQLAVPPMIEEMRQTTPHARFDGLPGLGHAPFLEDAARFNSVFADFALHVFRMEPAA